MSKLATKWLVFYKNVIIASDVIRLLRNSPGILWDVLVSWRLSSDSELSSDQQDCYYCTLENQLRDMPLPKKAKKTEDKQTNSEPFVALSSPCTTDDFVSGQYKAREKGLTHIPRIPSLSSRLAPHFLCHRCFPFLLKRKCDQTRAAYFERLICTF